MSERDIRRIYAAAVVGPMIAGILIINEYVEPKETTLLSSMVWWWLVGMMLFPIIVMPPYVYGYHNRNSIDVKDEEPLSFAPGLRGALLGTAAVPLARALYVWLEDG